MNGALMDEEHFLKVPKDEAGVKGLRGATGCSTCHTRGSPRPAVGSGLDR